MACERVKPRKPSTTRIVNFVTRQKKTERLSASVQYLKGSPKDWPLKSRRGVDFYSSTLSLTSALNDMGGERYTLASLPMGMTRNPLSKRLIGLWGSAEKIVGTGIRSPDRPARSE